MTPQAQILTVSPQMSINVLQAYYETPSDKNKNMPRSPRKATDSFVCLHLFWFVFVFAISVILYEIEHSVSATGDVKNRYKVVRNYVGPSCTISAFLWKERHTSEVLTETWSTVLKAWLHSSSSLSPSLFLTSFPSPLLYIWTLFSSSACFACISPLPVFVPSDAMGGGSGMGTGAIVGILIVVFFLLLVGVDVTCYFLNKCGLLMCIAVNFCGKAGPGAKSKDIEEGKAAFT